MMGGGGQLPAAVAEGVHALQPCAALRRLTVLRHTFRAFPSKRTRRCSSVFWRDRMTNTPTTT